MVNKEIRHVKLHNEVIHSVSDLIRVSDVIIVIDEISFQ